MRVVGGRRVQSLKLEGAERHTVTLAAQKPGWGQVKHQTNLGIDRHRAQCQEDQADLSPFSVPFQSPYAVLPHCLGTPAIRNISVTAALCLTASMPLPSSLTCIPS